MTDYLKVFSVIAAVLATLYYYFISTFDFWKRRGVPGPQPILGFGNIKDIIFARHSWGNYVTKIYNEYKNEPLIGMFSRRTPTLVVCDLDLIKDVLIKDFATFGDRGSHIFEKAEPMSVNIINLEPERWRTLRTRLSPVFTSGKIKEMYPLILECSEQLEKHLEKKAEEGKAVECREMAAKFTTDVIGSCAFGINMNALSDEESQFRKMGRDILALSPSRLVRLAFREAMPWLYSIVGCAIPPPKFTIFFTKIISDTINYRKRNNIVRPDFVNMLIEMKDEPEKLHNIKITDAILAAQAVVFFVAGFETSSTTISHALYEMALNPDMQDKLREEIRECNKKTNGDFDYESVKGMKYLDKVYKETLRKYPPIMVLRRKSNTNYTFNGTKVSIFKKTPIIIPVYAIHHDPSIYPNPETFDPERFNEDAVAARHPMSYLPFGDGPRNCIGSRFAIYQTKVGLIKMLQNFTFEVCDETMTSYVEDPSAFVMGPKEGIRLKISKVKN